MATLPNTNVLDTTDTTTLNLLQQAFNLASLSNNASAAASIAAAAQALSLNGNVGSANIFSTGNGGFPPGTTGGPMTGIVPTGPSVTTQPNIGSGPILLPPTRTTTPITNAPGLGGGGVINPGTTPTTVVGVPINTGPIGPVTQVGGGTLPGGGTEQTLTSIPCSNPTYRLGKIREYQTSYGTGNINPSINAQLSISLPPDFQSLDPKQCVLVAEVFKCCTNGNLKSEQLVGTVQLAESQISYYYEDCPDGSKRPVIKQFYDVDKIDLLNFVKVVPSGRSGIDNLVTTAESSTLLNQSVNWKWGNGSCNALSAAQQTSTVVYPSFQDYLNATFPVGILIGEPIPGNNSRLISSINIQTSALGFPFFTNAVSRTISRSITATCNYNGGCVKVNTGGGGGTTKVCPPDLPGNYTVEVPNSKVMLPYTETIISTATEQTTIPDQKCYVGNEQTYSFEEGYTVTKAIVCSDGSYLNTKTERVITRSGTGKRWINPIKSYDGPDCQCIEVAHPNDSYTDPSDPCGCHELLTETIYIVCPDEPNYPNIGPNSKKSTKVYNLPSEPGVRLVSKLKRADCTDDPIRIYHPLVLGKDIINGKVKGITKGLFNLSQSLDCYYTSSTQNTASKSHYYEITDCDSCGKTPYFAVAYGNQLGSGSLYSQGELFDTTTKAVYSQYRLLALEAPERFFKFYTNGQTNPDTKDIYVINYYRNGLSDRLDPGNFEISLAELRGGSYANNVFTGSNVAVSSSNKVITLIDNSGDRSETTTCSEDPYVSYDIVSGSLNNGIHDSGTGSISTNPNITTYGTVYPNLGIIVLDPHKLNTQLGFNSVTGSNIAGDNAFKLHTAISGAAALGSPMKARNVKYKTTNHYFVRVPAPQANYSNNPTYVTDSLLPEEAGQFAHACFQKDPQTYITSIGLYNNNRDLIAVAKLSRPVKKTSDNDVLIKIRLNW